MYRKYNVKLLKKTRLGASDGICQTVFVLECCMLRGRSLSGNVEGQGFGGKPPASHEKYLS